MMGRSRWISSMKRTSPSLLIGEHAHEVRRFLQHGPRRGLEVHAHFSRAISDANVVLPSPGRAVKEQVVQWFPALFGRLDGDAHMRLADLVLADELLEALGPKRGSQRRRLPGGPPVW